MIAAHRAGIERIILSKKNERDLRDVPTEVKDALTFYFVESAEEVLKIALDVDPARGHSFHGGGTDYLQATSAI